jgi:hypothetical protein
MPQGMSRVVLLLALLGASVHAAPAGAQTAAPQQPEAAAPDESEQTEPRIIGRPGTMMLGFAGFVNRFQSSEDLFPANYTVQIDLTRFLTKKIAVRGALGGSGAFLGEEDSDLPTGPSAMALHVGGGPVYYFTPESMLSFYAGAEYWAQITQRAERDSGSVIGKGGLQAALSSRASFFAEGGYGLNLTKGDSDETVTRFVGQIGIRIRF